MLDKYLEESILNKATILQIILEFQTIDIEQLAQLTEFSEKIIYQHLAELKEEFNDLFYLKVFANTAHLDLITKINPSICFHRIYQSSTFLHLLRYFLQEEKESFICFIQKEYISRATGYRIRDKCLDFLKEVGLSLDRYQVIGPEYRIRFLIALLEYKFGIHLYEIKEKELKLVYQWIRSSNAHISQEAFEAATEESRFFSILVVLMWKRKNFPVVLPASQELEKLKTLLVYPKLITLTKKILEPALQVMFTPTDYDYLFLAYCTTPNPFSRDKWLEHDRDTALDIIMKQGMLLPLIQKFRLLFGDELINSQPFRIVMLFFMKPFICNLQSLVPNSYIFQYDHRGLFDPLYLLLSQLVKEWMKEVGLTGEVYKYHIYHVTIQLRELIYANMAPISLYIFASNNADVTTLKNAFSRNIPPSITRIVVIDFLNSSLHLQDHEETNIIVADQHISTYIKSLFPDKEHILINFSMNFYDIHYQHIYEAIYKLRKERYQEYINGLKKLL